MRRLLDEAAIPLLKQPGHIVTLAELESALRVMRRKLTALHASKKDRETFTTAIERALETDSKLTSDQRQDVAATLHTIFRDQWRRRVSVPSVTVTFLSRVVF